MGYTDTEIRRALHGTDSLPDALFVLKRDHVTDWFGEWLTSQLQLQRNAFGVEPAEQGPEYITSMFLGLFSEVGEMEKEVDWKYWSSTRGSFNREELIVEATDALHFLGNILLWAGVSGEELTAAYHAKQVINEQRQENGYSALNKER